jgi:glycosyltransferase involved in cell wall biosynthesis
MNAERPPLLIADGDIATTRLVARELGTVHPEVAIRTPDNLFGTRIDGRRIVVSRLCHPRLSWLPAHFAERGIRYAYFLDDNFWELTPDVDPHLADFFNHPAVVATLERFLRGASVVIVWSSLLGDYLRERLPGLDVAFAAPGFDAATAQRLLAGASARGGGHANELRVGYPTTRRPGVAELLTAVVRHFAAVRGSAVKFEFVGWMPDSLVDMPNVTMFPHVADYDRYLELVVSRHWDIAIAPLAGGTFESYKTDVKYREYGGCRIAGMYSRVPPYSTTIEHGRRGILVDNDPAAWIAALERLLDAPATREAIAQAAFDDVSTHRDLRVTGKRFASLVPAPAAE